MGRRKQVGTHHNSIRGFRLKVGGDVKFGRQVGKSGGQLDKGARPALQLLNNVRIADADRLAYAAEERRPGRGVRALMRCAKEYYSLGGVQNAFILAGSGVGIVESLAEH